MHREQYSRSPEVLPLSFARQQVSSPRQSQQGFSSKQNFGLKSDHFNRDNIGSTSASSNSWKYDKISKKDDEKTDFEALYKKLAQVSSPNSSKTTSTKVDLKIDIPNSRQHKFTRNYEEISPQYPKDHKNAQTNSSLNDFQLPKSPQQSNFSNAFDINSTKVKSNTSINNSLNNEEDLSNLLKKPKSNLSFNESQSKQSNNSTDLMSKYELECQVKELEKKLKNQTRYNQDILAQSEEYRRKIASLEKEIDLLKNSSYQIQNLNKRISYELNELKEENSFLKSQVQNLEGNQSHSRQQIYKLNKELNQKQVEFQNLINKLENFDDNCRNQVHETKIKRLQETIQNLKQKQNSLILQNSQLNEEIREREVQIQQLKVHQKKNGLDESRHQNNKAGINKILTSKNMNAVFDQTLRSLMKQIDQLKELNETRDQEKKNLKNLLNQSKKELEVLREEFKIAEIKAATDRKNARIELENTIQNKENQISTINKKIKTWEDKYQCAVKDIKQKDDFFKQFLVGRSPDVTMTNYIENILKNYEGTFSSFTDLKSEIAQLKQRLNAYESNK